MVRSQVFECVLLVVVSWCFGVLAHYKCLEYKDFLALFFTCCSLSSFGAFDWMRIGGCEVGK